MFKFLDMMFNYEDRKVDRYEEGNLIVDTCAVTDSDQPYETGVCHTLYNDGDWVIVEMYEDERSAKEGHDRWVKVMTDQVLPSKLEDVSTAEIEKLCKMAKENWKEA